MKQWTIKTSVRLVLEFVSIFVFVSDQGHFIMVKDWWWCMYKEIYIKMANGYYTIPKNTQIVYKYNLAMSVMVQM